LQINNNHYNAKLYRYDLQQFNTVKLPDNYRFIIHQQSCHQMRHIEQQAPWSRLLYGINVATLVIYFITLCVHWARK